jgi:hypothetical protein
VNARLTDFNADGKPDKYEVLLSDGSVCKVVDFNFNGRFDFWRLHDAQGNLRSEAYDIDDDGDLDQVVVYTSSGKVDSRDFDDDGAVDEQHVYVDGVCTRYLDLDHDGAADKSESCVENADAEP